MDITLMQVKAFLVVSRLGSFTKAAHVLHISQPGLTVQIRQLEAALNLRLFDRNTRHVDLTRPGRELVPMFQRLVQDFDAIIGNSRDISSKSRGIIRIACLPSFASVHLPAMIADFRKRHPQVSYILRDAMGRRIVDMVRAEEVELGIADCDPNLTDLETYELTRDQIHVVFPKSHPISHQKRVTLEIIAQCPLVLMDPGASTRTMLDAAFVRAGRLVMPVCEATYISTAIAMVRAGLGLALLSSLSIKAANLRSFSTLRSRPVNDISFTRSIRLIKNTGRSLSPAAEAFANALIETSKRGVWKDLRKWKG